MAFRYRGRRLGAQEGSFTTRPDLGQPLTEREVIEELGQASSISEGDVRNVLTNLRRILVNAAQLTRPSEALFGLFRMGLSSGGKLTDPEGELTADQVAPYLNLYASAELQSQFRSGLSIERTGVDSERLPDIETVRNDATGALNTYTPGDVLRLNGSDLKLDPADPIQGVFFRNSAGSEVRATRYLTVTDGQILVLVPAALTGPQTLIVHIKYGPNLRQTTFDGVLSNNA